MKDWEIVAETIGFLANGLRELSEAEVDLEREEFLLPLEDRTPKEDRWSLHQSLEEWLSEADFLRQELLWLEFNLDTPLRADRFRSQVLRVLALAADANGEYLVGPEKFSRQAAKLQAELLFVADYCVELHDLICRISDKKSDTRKSLLPRNPTLVRFASEVKKRVRVGETKGQIARDFTDGDERQAESLLRQLRRYKHLLGDTDSADN
jgi:hypothetical protein